MAFNQSYSSGKINGNEIDIKRIYATKANAEANIGAVKISEKNASWKSDDLTYEIKGDVVMISNKGIPIGFTTLDALNDVAEANKSDTTIKEDYDDPQSSATDKDGTQPDKPGESGAIAIETFADDVIEEESEISDIPTVETVETDTTIEETYQEDSTEQVEDTPVQEEPAGDTTIEETYQDEEPEVVEEPPKVQEEETTIDETSVDETVQDVPEEINDVPEVEETNTEIDVEEEVPEPPIDVENIDETPAEETVIDTTAAEENLTEQEVLINEYASRIEAYGGNGHNNSDFASNVKNSGNPEAFLQNMGNLLNSVDQLNAMFEADGLGYSFVSSCFSGGAGHVSGDTRPSHGMGSKCDLHFYKNGVELNIGVNSSREDWQYITDCLNACGLGVQFEKGGTTWGDVFLQSALNSQNIEVAYDGVGWGRPMTYTNSNGGNMKEIY